MSDLALSIGAAARTAGLPVKTVRYYEEIGLVAPRRDGNGYRVFRPADLHRLTFLARARGLGFTIEDCRTLLALWDDRGRASAEVKAVARAHLDRIDTKMAALAEMRATLDTLVQSCAGDDRPDCPILRDLAGDERA